MAKTKKILTPAEEEQRARKRAANLEKARKARAKKNEAKIANLVWGYVKPRLGNCHCDLSKGMSLKELRKLGNGCTHPSFVCPTLDTYRRLMERPQSLYETKDAA